MKVWVQDFVAMYNVRLHFVTIIKFLRKRLKIGFVKLLYGIGIHDCSQPYINVELTFDGEGV